MPAENARQFLDTNILVYAHDRYSEPGCWRKADQAAL
jgi:predicted nucleic acid-binding protein